MLEICKPFAKSQLGSRLIARAVESGQLHCRRHQIRIDRNAQLYNNSHHARKAKTDAYTRFSASVRKIVWHCSVLHAADQPSDDFASRLRSHLAARLFAPNIEINKTSSRAILANWPKMSLKNVWLWTLLGRGSNVASTLQRFMKRCGEASVFQNN